MCHMWRRTWKPLRHRKGCSNSHTCAAKSDILEWAKWIVGWTSAMETRMASHPKGNASGDDLDRDKWLAAGCVIHHTAPTALNDIAHRAQRAIGFSIPYIIRFLFLKVHYFLLGTHAWNHFVHKGSQWALFMPTHVLVKECKGDRCKFRKSVKLELKSRNMFEYMWAHCLTL